MNRCAVALLFSGLLAFILPGASIHAAQAPWQRLPAAVALLDGAPVETRGLRLELPLVSEDGGAVPLSVSSDEAIESIHLFAARNPSPEIAVLRFHDAQVQPRVATRVRLNETQQVIALARTTDGRWLASSREVRITTSGCLARSDEVAAESEMITRVRAPAALRAGESGELLAMITHPMETGLRERADGTLVPRRLVSQFEVSMNATPLFEAELFAAMSASPFFRLQLAPQQAGELTLRWVEDGGREAGEQATITLR